VEQFDRFELEVIPEGGQDVVQMAEGGE